MFQIAIKILNDLFLRIIATATLEEYDWTCRLIIIDILVHPYDMKRTTVTDNEFFQTKISLDFEVSETTFYSVTLVHSV